MTYRKVRSLWFVEDLSACERLVSARLRQSFRVAPVEIALFLWSAIFQTRKQFVRDADIITHLRLNRPLSTLSVGAAERALIVQLAAGGDARIGLHSETGLNRYFSAPYPRDVRAYSSSTISDISEDAFGHLLSLRGNRASYRDQLAGLGDRIKTAFGVDNATEIVFAPSGTDLEYVALASVQGRGRAGVHNILLGADEIGSGCVHSARGRFFAQETALDQPVSLGADIPGFDDISLIDIPVRCHAGTARSGAVVADAMAREIERAISLGKHSLVHAVHGSKTGLVLPDLAEMDALMARFGDDMTFVIDACQARITSRAIGDYLARGAIVLMTGSKFVGAPPFNGWALVPQSIMAQAASLPHGLMQVCRHSEWPANWPGVSVLPESENPSLALRLEAAVFEIERFQALPDTQVTAIITAFEKAVSEHLIEPLGARAVVPAGAGLPGALPIEMRTMITIDVSMRDGLVTFHEARAAHASLALDGIRLGQPVKCVALDDGQGWGGTLRVGLSMPMMTRWAKLPIEQVQQELTRDMTQIAEAIEMLVVSA